MERCAGKGWQVPAALSPQEGTTGLSGSTQPPGSTCSPSPCKASACWMEKKRRKRGGGLPAISGVAQTPAGFEPQPRPPQPVLVSSSSGSSWHLPGSGQALTPRGKETPPGARSLPSPSPGEPGPFCQHSAHGSLTVTAQPRLCGCGPPAPTPPRPSEVTQDGERRPGPEPRSSLPHTRDHWGCTSRLGWDARRAPAAWGTDLTSAAPGAEAS